MIARARREFVGKLRRVGVGGERVEPAPELAAQCARVEPARRFERFA